MNFIRHGIYRLSKFPKEVKIFLLAVAMTALALGFSDVIFSNYFKEVYNVNAFLRGLIEFPRELPGVLCILVFSALSFLGDIRLTIVAQILCISGLAVLGFITPSFWVMLIFVFINSLGLHLLIPLQDGIGISLTKGENVGHFMGTYKAISTAFGMIAAIIVFFSFRYNILSFQTPIKLTFLISATLFFLVLLLYIYLNKLIRIPITERKFNLLIRKEYKYYYILSIMNGVQKQIMFVYGPWVLIEILSKKTDTIAILTIISSFGGTFFIPLLGRMVDRFGYKKLLYADALSFILVYLAYGFLVYGFISGRLSLTGLPVLVAFTIFVLDKMSMQMSIVRIIYLRSIAHSPEEITQTLSMGLSLDHIVTIFSAVAGGLVWQRFGPQYIFFFVASLSLVNLYVAYKVKDKIKDTH